MSLGTRAPCWAYERLHSVLSRADSLIAGELFFITFVEVNLTSVVIGGNDYLSTPSLLGVRVDRQR